MGEPRASVKHWAATAGLAALTAALVAAAIVASAGEGGSRTAPAPPTPQAEPSWPTSMPLLASSTDPRLVVMGTRVDLVESEDDLHYHTTIDLAWDAKGKPEEVLCNFQLVDSQGRMVFQREMIVEWFRRTYVDDWPIGFSREEIERGAPSAAPPAAATAICGDRV